MAKTQIQKRKKSPATDTAVQAKSGTTNTVADGAVASAPVNTKPTTPAAGAIASAPVMVDKK